MPFIGLSILSVMLVTEVDSGLSENTATWIRYLGWALLLTPGPVYIHLSWAPRWRLLCRLEEGLDPFEGELPTRPNSEMIEGVEDSDMEMAIEDIEDDPPLLHVEDRLAYVSGTLSPGEKIIVGGASKVIEGKIYN